MIHRRSRAEELDVDQVDDAPAEAFTTMLPPLRFFDQDRRRLIVVRGPGFQVDPNRKRKGQKRSQPIMAD